MEGKRFQVVDLKDGKGMSVGQSNEHLRKYAEGAYKNGLSNNFDPTREHLNFEVRKGGVVAPVDKSRSIPLRIHENLAARGITDPNEELVRQGQEPKFRTVVNIIFQGSTEPMRRLAFGEQAEQIDFNMEHKPDNSRFTRAKGIENWAVDVYNFVADKYGEDNIAAFVVHLDESNPHVHCTLLPVAEVKGKQRLSFHKVFGHSKDEMRQKLLTLHNELAEVNKKWGLERGRDIRQTGAKHRSSEEYRAWLRDTCTALEERYNDLGVKVSFLEQENQKAEKRLKGLTTMLNNLETRRADLVHEIEELTERGEEGSANLFRLQEELRAVNEKIEERKEQISDAELQLSEVRRKVSDVKGELSDVYLKKENVEGEYKSWVRKMENLAPELTKKVSHDMESSAWLMAIADSVNLMKNLAPTLTDEQVKIIDNSILDDMAYRANEVVAIATVLFLGYIDQATEFAQMRGGGSGPGSGWGRDKDEDDEHFRRRCLQMARKMMKGSQKRAVRR